MGNFVTWIFALRKLNIKERGFGAVADRSLKFSKNGKEQSHLGIGVYQKESQQQGAWILSTVNGKEVHNS